MVHIFRNYKSILLSMLFFGTPQAVLSTQIIDFPELEDCYFSHAVEDDKNIILGGYKKEHYGKHYFLLGLDKHTYQRTIPLVHLLHSEVNKIKVLPEHIAVLGDRHVEDEFMTEGLVTLHSKNTLKCFEDKIWRVRTDDKFFTFRDMIVEGEEATLVGGRGPGFILKCNMATDGLIDKQPFPDNDNRQVPTSIESGQGSVFVLSKHAGSWQLSIIKNSLQKHFNIGQRGVCSLMQTGDDIILLASITNHYRRSVLSLGNFNQNTEEVVWHTHQELSEVNLQDVAYSNGMILGTGWAWSPHEVNRNFLLTILSSKTGKFLIPPRHIALGADHAEPRSSLNLGEAVVMVGARHIRKSDGGTTPFPVCVVESLDLTLKERAQAVIQQEQTQLLSAVKDPVKKVMDYLSIQALIYDKTPRQVDNDVANCRFSYNKFTDEERLIVRSFATLQVLAGSKNSKAILSGINNFFGDEDMLKLKETEV